MSLPALEHFAKTVASASVTATDGWTTVGQLPASLFTAAAKYLLVVNAGVDIAVDIAVDSRVEVRILKSGGSSFVGSESSFRYLVEEVTTPYYNRVVGDGTVSNFTSYPYGYMTVFTQPGTPVSVDVQIRVVSAGVAAATIWDLSITAVNLANWTDGVDYFYNEDDDSGAPTALPTVPGGAPLSSFQTFATIAGDNASTAWLAIGHHNWLIDTVHANVASYLRVTGNSSGTVDWRGHQLRAGSTSDQLSQVVCTAPLNTAADTTTTLSVRLADIAGVTTASKHYRSAVFLLNLDVFLDGSTWYAATHTDTSSHPCTFAWTTLTDVAPEAIMTTDYSSLVFCSVQPSGASMRLIVDASSGDDVIWPPYFSAAVCAGHIDGLSHVMRTATKRSLASDSLLIPQHGGTSWTPGATGFLGFRYVHITTSPAVAFADAGALQLPAMTMAGTGTFAAITYTGTGTLDIPALTMDGTGTFEYAFTGPTETLEIPGLAMDGAGTFAMPIATGSGALDLPAMQLAGVGTFFIPVRHGHGSLRLPAIIADNTASYIPAPCSSPAYEARGRLPISVVQEQQYGTDYPFIAPSADIQNLIADLYLAYDDPADYQEGHAFEEPFHVAWFFGYGCVPSPRPAFVTAEVLHAADIVIHDASGRTVFDSTAAGTYREQLWGSHLRIHEWVGDSGTCRVVVQLKWPGAGRQPAPRDYDIHLVPDNGILDARTLHRMPKRIRKLIIDDAELSGKIQFENGYNTTLDYQGPLSDPSPLEVTLGVGIAATDGSRAGHRVEIGAEAGSGLGQSPGCDSLVLDILRINGVSPDQYGNLRLQTAGKDGGDQSCYWFEQPADRGSVPAVMTPATLEIHNDCLPCCTCDDYVQVKLGIDSLFDRWSSVATDVMGIRDQLQTNINRWNGQKACRDGESQRLILTSNCIGFIGLGYTFCANARECTGPLTVKFDFMANAAAGNRAAGGGSAAGTEGFAPEAMNNGGFSKGLKNWEGTGAFTISNSSGLAVVGRTTWDSAQNELANGQFTSNLASWTTAGYAQHVTLPGVVLGDPNGGIGRIAQTASVDAGETYKVRLFVSVSSGVNRLVISNGSGTVLLTQAIPAGLVDEYVEASVLATDGSLKVSIEAEVAAADTITLREVLLLPWSGTIWQTVNGLEPGQTYRSKTVLQLSHGTPTLDILDSENGSLLHVALPTDVPPFTIEDRTFQADSESVKVTLSSPAGDGAILKIVAVSLQQVILDGGNSPSGPESAKSAVPSSSGSVTVAYVPHTARKNDVTSQRLKAYEMTGSYPHFEAAWDKLNPGKAAKLSFMLFSCKGKDGDSVTVTATPTLNGVELPSITETVAIANPCMTKDQLCSDGT